MCIISIFNKWFEHQITLAFRTVENGVCIYGFLCVMAIMIVIVCATPTTIICVHGHFIYSTRTDNCDTTTHCITRIVDGVSAWTVLHHDTKPFRLLIRLITYIINIFFFFYNFVVHLVGVHVAGERIIMNGCEEIPLQSNGTVTRWEMNVTMIVFAQLNLCY